MDLDRFLALLKECPLIASVQASEGSPLEHPETLARLAQASASQGVKVLRAQGVANIRAIREATGLPAIGLIKKHYEGSEVYITPTTAEVEALLETGCEIIALDGTARERPDGVTLGGLIHAIHAAGRLALADCDDEFSAAHAADSGADLLSTTLSGYTERTGTASQDIKRPEPDIELVRRLVRCLGLPILAEGRYQSPEQAQIALRAGAAGVVVGGSLNDPVKQTRRFVHAATMPKEPIGAIDLGGTWLRFGLFSPGWKLELVERVPLPATMKERSAWLKEQISAYGVTRVGVSAGGTIERGRVCQAKSIVPDYLGTGFHFEGVRMNALNDGLASAWGHACLPEYAGLRVASLALGTGVGCGLADQGRLVTCRGGQTLKLNDLPGPGGRTYEELLGGAALTKTPTEDQMASARTAAVSALLTLQAMCLPDVIVVCGGVGLSDWLDVEEIGRRQFSGAGAADPAQPISPGDQNWDRAWKWPRIVRSPFGADAGLYGAAALALFPPVDLSERLGW